jgi:hypothetical protein
MRDRGEWIQIIILLIFVGLGLVKFLLQTLFSRAGRAAPPPQRPRSPAIDMLERLRADSERAATPRGGTLAEAATAAAPPAESAYLAGSKGEDAFFGDDEIDRETAVREDAVGRAPHVAAAEDSALDWELVRDEPLTPEAGAHAPAVQVPPRAGAGARPAASRPGAGSGRGPAARDRGEAERLAATRRTVELRIGAPVPLKEPVLHPRSEQPRREIAVPAAFEQQPAVSEELSLETTARDMAMAQIPGAADQEPAQRPPARAAESKRVDLRTAILGQVILGPPRSYRGPRGRDRPWQEI